MHDKEIGPHKTQYRRDENYVLLCWVTPDFELYAALADKALAIKTCNRVYQWIKNIENEIFLLGASGDSLHVMYSILCIKCLLCCTYIIFFNSCSIQHLEKQNEMWMLY